jgi:hypothetical protein
MFPASTNGGGMCFSMPDTCKVQVGPAVVPTPFPNQAQLADGNAATFSPKVKIENKNAATETSLITQSSGDEAGALGGVVSGVNRGPAQIKMGSKKVMVDGKGIAMLTSVVAQNGTNANMPVGTQIAPSQAKVLVAP